MEAIQIARVDREQGAIAGAVGELWGMFFELPNGRHLLVHGGSASRDVAQKFADHWLSKNPEAKFDVSTMCAMSQAEVDEHTLAIRAKYPHRKTLAELTGGEWTQAMAEPWRVPGSRVRPPRTLKATLAAGGWNDLNRW